MKIPRDTRAKTRQYLLVALTPLSLIYAVGTLIFTLEPLSTLGVSFFLFLVYIFIADNISISMYIMCVILCLFSALSRRVGALQIFVIIIIIIIIIVIEANKRVSLGSDRISLCRGV